jgi:hypothetical protein
MFINKFFSKFVLSTGIQRDVDPNGKPTPMPTEPDQVNERGSDHDGLFMILDFAELLKARAS